MRNKQEKKNRDVEGFGGELCLQKRPRSSIFRIFPDMADEDRF